MKIARIVAILFASSLATTARADTFYPMLMSVDPVAVQTGASIECTVHSRYSLEGTYKVFITGTGVTGEPVAPAAPKPGAKSDPTRTTIRLKADADALPGPRDIRLATPQGVSTVGQIVVVRDPVIVEKPGNNDTLKTAQPITLPASVCGTIDKVEDVDYYKFTVAANTALTFHVWSQRLQNRIHDLQDHSDPIITLKNASGTVLAANDNYFAGDSLLHYKFAQAGDYYLEIRDARYGGNRYWTYCIEIHDRPFVITTFPSALTPGKATKLQLIGHNLPADPTVTYTLPADTPEGSQRVAVMLPDGRKTNSIPIEVSKLAEVIEVAGAHATPATAQAFTAPAGIAGRIEKEDEVDCYTFEAKAGEKFTFDIVAREHQSAIDSNLRILNDKGARLSENDDHRDKYVHADSRIENWAAPANGKYTIEVRDVHDRGGAAFTYFLKVTRAEPFFTVDIDTDKTLLAPGINGAIFVRATRKNGFTGDIDLKVEGLPPGVTASLGKIPAAGQDGSILLRAAADAPRGAANLRITATGTHTPAGGKPITYTTDARPLQEIYMPGGGRFHFPVDTHTVSVGDPLDIRSVKIVPNSIILKPGESRKIDITIERAPGFKGNVTLDAVYQHLGGVFANSLPPGVTVDDKASKTLLNGEQTQGHITLKAAPTTAPIANHQSVIMAHVSINFVMKFTYCGEPLLITIAK
jgi:hypothetical protein